MADEQPIVDSMRRIRSAFRSTDEMKAWMFTPVEEAVTPIPDDPDEAFMAALDVMTRTMLAHPDHHDVAAAFGQDDLDELRAGTPIFQATAYMDLIQRWVSMEASDGD